MILARDVYDLVSKALRYTSEEDLQKMRATCNLAYLELCQLTDWVRLRRKASTTLTLGGVYTLPATAIDVVAVTNSSGAVYGFCEEHELQCLTDGRPRWFYAAPADGSAAGLQLTVGVADGLGAQLAGSVTIWYWVSPPTLQSDQVPILLPGARPLVLKTIIDVLGLLDKKEAEADRYRTEYESAIQEMLAKNPVAVPHATMRTRHGVLMKRGGRR